MRHLRSRGTRVLLALCWITGTIAMSAEAMLPDPHAPHAHHDVAGAVPDAGHAGDLGHHGTEACHCSHAHISGVAVALVRLPTFPGSTLSQVPPAAALHSRAASPPWHPPRA